MQPSSLVIDAESKQLFIPFAPVKSEHPKTSKKPWSIFSATCLTIFQRNVCYGLFQEKLASSIPTWFSKAIATYATPHLLPNYSYSLRGDSDFLWNQPRLIILFKWNIRIYLINSDTGAMLMIHFIPSCWLFVWILLFLFSQVVYSFLFLFCLIDNYIC